MPRTGGIRSAAPGATFIEGETVPVAVAATDDVAVVSVTLKVDGVVAGTDTTAPYQFTVTAPVGAAGLTLEASGIDLGSNVGTAAPLHVNVVPDPLTTAVGRVIDSLGAPLQGAAVTCLGRSAVSGGDGTFAVSNLPTIQPTIGCTTTFSGGGTALYGTSVRTAPVRGGLTQVGDIRLLAVPIITSISPRRIDSYRAPNALPIRGANFTSRPVAC